MLCKQAFKCVCLLCGNARKVKRRNNVRDVYWAGARQLHNRAAHRGFSPPLLSFRATMRQTLKEKPRRSFRLSICQTSPSLPESVSSSRVCLLVTHEHAQTRVNVPLVPSLEPCGWGGGLVSSRLRVEHPPPRGGVAAPALHPRVTAWAWRALKVRLFCPRRGAWRAACEACQCGSVIEFDWHELHCASARI